MEDWYNPNERSVMSVEDARGGELLELIIQASGDSRNIIQAMMSHSPLVANSLNVLDMHYSRIFGEIEKALRLKKDRPEGELQQLAILEKLNAYLKANYSCNPYLRVTRMRHGQVYAQSYVYSMPQLPARTYVLASGQANPIAWTADLNEDGNPRVSETFGVLTDAEGKKNDGECVVTELLKVAMDEVVISQTTFVKLLLAEREKGVLNQLVWPIPRICYIQKAPNWREMMSYFRRPSYAFGGRTENEERTANRFDFQYEYPFCVGTRRQDKTVFTDRVEAATMFITKDTRYAMAFYKDGVTELNLILYELASGTVKEHFAQWKVEEYLKNTLVMFEGEYHEKTTSLYGPELEAACVFFTKSLSPEEIKDNAAITFENPELVSACVAITFKEPVIITGEFFNRCTGAFAYTLEDKDGTITRKITFKEDMIDHIDLDSLESGSNY